MTVAISGAFGSVGQGTIEYLKTKNVDLVIMDQDTPKNRRTARHLSRRRARWSPSAETNQGKVRIELGDIRDQAYLKRSLEGVDAFVHLAAIIPPLADRQPELARSVNIDGTRAAIAACENQKSPPRFILASSIAIYGDRLLSPWIAVGDPLDANPDDEYARTKIAAEGLVNASKLRTAILRLTYVVDPGRMKMDPLFFHVPLATSLEVLHRDDAGRAFAEAALNGAADGMTLNIGGGAACRTSYRAYLEKMFNFFGFGGFRLPDAAFAKTGFHCGWFSDSDQAQSLLHFRRVDLAQIYRRVDELTRLRRWPTFIVHRLAEKILLKQSLLGLNSQPSGG